MINNYYKQGPSSKNSYFYNPDSNPLNGDKPSPLSKSLDLIGKKGIWGNYYIKGNTVELKNGEVYADTDWKGIYPRIDKARDEMEDNAKNREKIKEQIKLISEVDMPAVYTQSATDAYNKVLEHAGANLVRDAVDTRIINDVKNRTGALIDSQTEVGGWPAYTTYNVRQDTDKDGIPDYWEDLHGLDKNKHDAKEKTLDKNYTNLEVYLNSLVEHLY